MTARKKPETPQEQWQALVDFGRGAEAHELAEMTAAEVDAALKSYGYDLEKVDRDGEALLQKLLQMKASAGAPVVSIRSRGRRFVEEFPYFAAAAGLIGAVIGQSAGVFGPAQLAKADNPDHVTPPPVDTIAKAKALRERAAKECAKKAWVQCRATLTEAFKLDEDGASAFDVESLRREANEGIAEEEFENSRMRPRR